MNKIKIQKVLAVISVASAFLLTGGSQAFASFQTVNTGTGFESTNDVSALATNNFANVNQNTQVVANVGGGNVESGDNSVYNDYFNGGMTTGLINANSLFANNFNNNSLTGVGGWITDPIAQNDITGAFSDNDANSVFSQNIGNQNLNDANLANQITVNAESGDNLMTDNGTVGIAGTGNILGTFGAANTVNSNFTNLVAPALIASPLSQATNSFTGSNSSNDATIAADSNIGIENNNNADIANNVFATLDSGDNTIVENYGLGNAVTGGVAGQTLIGNNVNSNFTAIAAGLGNPQIAAGNNLTGADSVNNATATSSQSVAVSNVNNAELANNVTTSADSGNNLVSGNIALNPVGLANLTTGNASNAVAINNGGDGTIAAGIGSNVNSTTVSVGTGALVLAAANTGTGFDSLNNVSASTDNNVAVQNTNDMTVANNVVSSADSGNNTADSNGGVAITGGVAVPVGGIAVVTGNAANGTTITNDVNANSTAVTINPTLTVASGNNLTGADSVNNSTTSIENNIAVSNTNDSTISNNVTTTSNSGNNDVSGNAAGGVVATGAASLTMGVVNTGNSNTTIIGQ